ncbi:acyl-CoA thioesterase [Staphylococcus condimenti]|nr:acyl-CoA thioesterase [Staphylococcus condimenti]APR60666.1 acyl-CoA thioesterase [Staphylococcus condimenti]OFP00395.1 acyl-CoA thioesterase [Staphylococcus sp. HMSC065E08]VEG63971.1 cytosolic long-chain acyl-CoA thioester hydrolase family protein [Staphylococcus condimenti]
MEDREKRPMSASLSIKDRQVYPQDTNHHHTMFGGLLMANIDEIAAICAMKHSSAPVVTASTDSVDFLLPIRTGDVISYEAMVSYAGSTSMEVCVQIILEDIMEDKKYMAALSFLTFVALDDNGKPKKVPGVYPENEIQEWFHKTAPARVKRRKERRQESKETLEFLTRTRHIQ